MYIENVPMSLPDNTNIVKRPKRLKRNLFKRGSLFSTALILCATLFIQPSKVQALECGDSVTLSAGMAHTVGLKEDGTVVAVGYNKWGLTNVSGWSGIKAVDTGYERYTIGLKENGRVVYTGTTGYGLYRVRSWSGIKALAAGTTHIAGLKEDGTVIAVGYNRYGQTVVSGWSGIKAIAAGGVHTVGLKEDSTVVAAGHNDQGQKNVSDWTGIKAVSAGWGHTVGLKEDGTVVAVGSNLYGQLNVSGWTGIKAVSAGDYSTVGLKEDGTVVAVGWDIWGQISNVSGWTGIKAVSAGGWHIVGLRGNGTVVNSGDSGPNVSGWSNIKQPSCGPSITADAGSDQVVEQSSVSGAEVTLDATGSEGDALDYDWTWSGGSASGVNPTVLLPAGDTEVTLTITSGSNTSTDTATVTVQDTIRPSTSVLTSGTPGDNDWYVSTVNVSLLSDDSGSGVLEIHYSVNSGTEQIAAGDTASVTIASDGTYSITYRAVDNAGNAEYEGTIEVNIDTTAPVVTPPTDVTAEATGVQSPVDTGSATATDAVGVVSITSDAPATFPIGTTVVTWTAKDTAGNVGTATQNVTVVDTTAPVVTPPADVTAEATGVQSPVDTGSATATDAVGVVSITSDAPAAFPIGTTVVTWTAKDAAGNVGTATQNVTVVDTTAPVVTSPADVTAEATGVQSPVDTGSATAKDAVGVVSITSDAPAAFPIGTTVVTWTAKDAAGNVGTATQDVTVVDTTAPSITITAPAAGDYLISDVLTIGYSAVDAASGVAYISATLDGQAVTNGQAITLYRLAPAPGSHTLTVISEDNAGNQASKSVTFNVKVTAKSLSDLIDILLASGEIDSAGVANSLKKQLKSGNINALLKHIDAQEGKHISGYAAELLRTAIASLS